MKRQHNISGESGASLTELIISVGVMGLVVLGMSQFMLMINSVGLKTTNIDSIDEARYLLQRNISCSETMQPAGVVTAACNNTTPLPASGLCDSLPGLAVQVKSGKNTRTMINAGGTKVGRVELRACCPSGRLRIDGRVLKADRSSVAEDPLTKKELDWRPLFAAPTICPSLEVGSQKEIRVVQARTTLTHPTSNCPGYFRNVPSLQGPEAILHFFDGTANCPTGYRLIGGGGRCENSGIPSIYFPRSGVADSHPSAPTSPDGSLKKAKGWFVSCCGSLANPLSTGNNVYALCQKE